MGCKYREVQNYCCRALTPPPPSEANSCVTDFTVSLSGGWTCGHRSEDEKFDAKLLFQGSVQDNGAVAVLNLPVWNGLFVCPVKTATPMITLQSHQIRSYAVGLI